MDNKLIFVLGDVHSRWYTVNTIIDSFFKNNDFYLGKEVIFLQVGDFGIFEQSEINNIPIDNRVPGLVDDHIKIYFCDGNHENHDLLDKLELENKDEKFIEVSPYIYYATFGSILTVNNKNIMFAGGAASIDKDLRIVQEYHGGTKTWWVQEEIDEYDMNNLPDVGVDIVISHTSPNSFTLQNIGIIPFMDKSRSYLEDILNRYKPSNWYYGHFHTSESGSSKGCKWRCVHYSDKKDLVEITHLF